MMFKLIIIYRPPYSSTHPVSMGTFFNKLIEYLESVILCPHPVLITGDFNVHVDNPSNDDALKFLDLLESLGLEQHVQEATHTHGHTLDLIITRIGDEILQETPKPDFCISDHISIISKILLPKPSLIKKTIQYRKIKNVNISELKNDIRSSNLLSNTHHNINEFSECFNTTLSRLLEAHAPLITKTITTRPCVPWYSDEIKAIKRRRRKAEKLWRGTKKDSDLMNFKSIRNEANYLMKQAKCHFYTDIVNENSHNQKKLYAVAKNLLIPKKELCFPDHHDMNSLANELGQYFTTKVETIRSQLNSFDTQCASIPSSTITCQLLDFDPLSEEDVQKLILDSAKKSCSLDPMPTSLMLKCQDILLPVITSLINLSLETGQFPDVGKEAIGYPLLKDVDCGTTFTNLRLISNLSYISKLTEKAVFQQLNKYLSTHELYPKLQSAYRKHHSTETALLKVINDILVNMNSQHVSLLVLLDLSAAFDTIDHSLLIDRLKYKLGVNGTVLAWFSSYLTNRKQRIHINGSISEIFALNYGVPQGSCLGPLLFIIYASEMFSVIESHPPSSHGYADDTQLYCSINPYCADAQVVAVQDMENCISDVRDWTTASKLKMNDDKLNVC